MRGPLRIANRLGGLDRRRRRRRLLRHQRGGGDLPPRQDEHLDEDTIYRRRFDIKWRRRPST